MIEDGVLLVRSNSVEPLYRPRATRGGGIFADYPSPSDCLALFRSMIILDPIERRILEAIKRKADAHGWAERRSVIRSAMNGSAPAALIAGGIETLVAAGKVEIRKSGRAWHCQLL